MARAGLGSSWKCLLANDNSQMKRDCYVSNWGGADHFECKDVGKLDLKDLPRQADMAWASFPCQDLSLAGNYAGIGSADDTERTRSGAFWGFWQLMEAAEAEGKHPPLIVLENVCGILTSNGGEDFRVLGDALSSLDYKFGALLIDASHFLPQSRPRVFIVAVQGTADIASFEQSAPSLPWHTPAIEAARKHLSPKAQRDWVWWKLSAPPKRRSRTLEGIVGDDPKGVSWHSADQTEALLKLMSARDRKKLAKLKEGGARKVATIYKRTRAGKQMAELRADGIAGCLRTPGGGSSRQIVMVVHGEMVRTRLLSPREAALLMGLRPTFRLPERYNDAYHVAGDGVAVPAVRHLSKHLLTPLAQSIAAVVAEPSSEIEEYELEAAE